MSLSSVSKEEFEFYYDQFGGAKYPVEFNKIDQETYGMTLHEDLVAKVLPTILAELFRLHPKWINDPKHYFTQAADLSNELAKITNDQTELFYQNLKKTHYETD
jgi:hypothetical protein